MKHIVIIFLLGTFTFLGQSKIDRDLGDFSKVAVYDGINLELVKSDENKVEITGKNTNFVVVKNKNGDLKIRLNLERRFSWNNKITFWIFWLFKNIYHIFVFIKFYNTKVLRVLNRNSENRWKTIG